MGGEDDRVSDRSVVIAGWAIIVVATMAFAWFLTFGHGDLFATRAYAGFFDLQTRAMAHGRFSVPDGSLGYEGFVIDGHTFAYFGVFPSALRLPIFAFTDRLDGRLSGASMLIAYVLALRGCLGLVRNVRCLARPGSSWTRTGALAALVSLTVFAVGSNLFFLSSAAWVYHEAALWGAAGVLASFAAITSYLRRPRGRAIAAAGAWATVAWLSRGSVGLGPSLALGLIALDHLLDLGVIRAFAPRPPSDAAPADTAVARRRRQGVALLAAGAIGAVAFGVINTAKFGSPTALPLGKQVGSKFPIGNRQKAFDAYDGSLFSNRLIPVTVAQSLRPDVVAPTRVFPYLRFTHAAPFDIGDPVFDTVEPTAGLTVTEPSLLLGAAFGVVTVFRPRRRFGRDRRGSPGDAADGLSALRPLLIGAVVGALAPFTIAFIAQRYLTDVFPLLAVGVAAAVAATDRRSATRSTRLLKSFLSVAMVLAVVGVLTTLSTTWTFQRLMIPPSPSVRAEALRTQVRIGRHLGRPPTVERGAALPTTVPTDSIYVVGRCAGLYYGQPENFWAPVERRAGTGVHRFRVPVTAATMARRAETLVASVGEGPAQFRFVLRAVDSGRLVVELRRPAGTVRGDPFAAHAGRDLILNVDADPARDGVAVTEGERQLLFTFGGSQATGPIALGRGVSEVPIPVPTCIALTAPA